VATIGFPDIGLPDSAQGRGDAKTARRALFILCALAPLVFALILSAADADRKFEDVVKSAQDAIVLILVY